MPDWLRRLVSPVRAVWRGLQQIPRLADAIEGADQLGRLRVKCDDQAEEIGRLKAVGTLQFDEAEGIYREAGSANAYCPKCKGGTPPRKSPMRVEFGQWVCADCGHSTRTAESLKRASEGTTGRIPPSDVW